MSYMLLLLPFHTVSVTFSYLTVTFSYPIVTKSYRCGYLFIPYCYSSTLKVTVAENFFNNCAENAFFYAFLLQFYKKILIESHLY